MRRILFALCLAITAASTQACNRTPTSSREDRPFSVFQPYLTRQLTPSAARTQFGAPDEITGSGLLIYKYRVAGGQTLWLGFPGEAAITYAKLQARDGALTELQLQ